MTTKKAVGKVAEAVLREMAEGRWMPPARFPSARDLARTLKASKPTVIAALRRLASAGVLRIEPRKRVKVQPAASDQVPALLRRRVFELPGHRLAILYPAARMPVRRNDLHSALLRALGAEAGFRGSTLTVVTWSVDNQITVATGLPGQGYHRAIILGFEPHLAAGAIRMPERGFPCVLFGAGAAAAGLAVPTVDLDEHGASRQMAEQLIALGHRNLCLVAHPRQYDRESTDDRGQGRGKVAGWLEGLCARNVLKSCAMPVYVPWPATAAGWGLEFRRVMRGAERPTAIVFAEEESAKAFAADREFSRLPVPGRLSLATLETKPRSEWAVCSGGLAHVEVYCTRTAQAIIETLDAVAGSRPVRLADDGCLAAADSHAPRVRVAVGVTLAESVGPPHAAPQKVERSE